MLNMVAASLVILAMSAITVLADDSLDVRAQQWLESLRKQIPKVSDSQQSVATAMYVAVLVETGHDTEARTIALQRENDDTKNSLLISISSILAKRGRHDSAFSTIGEISDAKLKERATHFVAMELAQQGEIDRAETLLQGMSESYNRERVVTEICHRLARDGRFDEAFDRARDIADSYRRSEATKFIERMRDGTPSPLEQLDGSLYDRVHMLTAFSSDGVYDSAISAIVAAQAGDREQAIKLINESIRNSSTPDIPSRKLPTAILLSVAYVEIGDAKSAGEMVEKLYEGVGRDWTGLTSFMGKPILMSLLVRLGRFDAIDAILERERDYYKTEPTSSSYMYSLTLMGESLVEYSRLEEFDLRLAGLQSADEKIFLIMGAMIGAEYARQPTP